MSSANNSHRSSIYLIFYMDRLQGPKSCKGQSTPSYISNTFGSEWTEEIECGVTCIFYICKLVLFVLTTKINVNDFGNKLETLRFGPSKQILTIRLTENILEMQILVTKWSCKSFRSNTINKFMSPNPYPDGKLIPRCHRLIALINTSLKIYGMKEIYWREADCYSWNLGRI